MAMMDDKALEEKAAEAQHDIWASWMQYAAQSRELRVKALEAEVERLRAALTDIAKGEGRYNRDPLTHASNTIEDMQALARAALRGEGVKR